MTTPHHAPVPKETPIGKAFQNTWQEHNKQVEAEACKQIDQGRAVFLLHSISDEWNCTCGSACGREGKHPPHGGNGLKNATKDKEKIRSQIASATHALNLGIRTGEISGITVIDIDIGDGKFGAESWAEAIEGHGEPVTLMSKTGSGGVHVVFAYNSALPTAANVLGKGIDVRNDGGYIVAAPSRHRSGGVYSWLNEDEALAVLPAHLSRRKETRGRKRKDAGRQDHPSIEEVRSMLEVVPADDYNLWRNVGIILGRHFNRVDEAWQLYQDWASKWGGKKSRIHGRQAREAFYELSQQDGESNLTIGTIIKAARDSGWVRKTGEVNIENFVYYAPGNNYIYRPTNSYWIAAAVDAAVSPVNENGKIVKASEWLKANRLVTSMTRDPAIKEGYNKDMECQDGTAKESKGAALYNTYRKPDIELGDARLAQPFVDHVSKVFLHEGDADQFLNYMAHRVQKPEEKPRFALLIAGGQGVGKDTAVEFCCPAIGAWNVSNVDPSAFETQFNEYGAATLVRISEAANLHDMNKFAFNERTKVLIAGNPDTMTINPKYGQKFSVRMHCGVIITTNHLASGIYIPADDRRYDVIESARLTDMGLDDAIERRQYFADLWDWFNAGGANHVAAFLHERDISRFSASNGQRKTEAHTSVVQIGRERHAWLYDILEELGHPEFISLPSIREHAKNGGEDVSSSGTFPGRAKNALDDAGYIKYRNPKTGDGRWYKAGHKKGFVIYAKVGTPQGLDPRDRVKADGELF